MSLRSVLVRSYSQLFTTRSHLEKQTQLMHCPDPIGPVAPSLGAWKAE